MKKILVRGPALSRSGYGEQTRFALRSLREHQERFDIYLINLNWGQTSWVWEDNEERTWIDELIKKTIIYMESFRQKQINPHFDISLQVTIPNEWEKLAPINIGYTAGIETTKIAPQWIEKANLMDKIIVVSNHAKEVFENTTHTVEQNGQRIESFKCHSPIEVVNYAVRESEPVDIGFDLDYDFNFLTVAQISPRKYLDKTVEWFVEEFIDREVGLVVKCNIANDSLMDRWHTQLRLQNLLSKYENRKCKIYLIHGSMKEEEIASLYKHPKIKAYVTTTHGEGFGLPMFEAAYNDLPIVAANWSGYLDFLYAPVKDKKTKKETMKAHFAKVRYQLKPIEPEAVWDGVLQEDSMWCYPDQGSFKMKIRELYRDYDRYKKQAKKLNKYIRKTFTEEAMYGKFANAVFKEEEHDIQEWLDNMDVQVHD